MPLRKGNILTLIGDIREKIDNLESIYCEENADKFKNLIDELGLTLRATCALKAEEIYYIEDLLRISEDELIKIPGFSMKSLYEIKIKLKERNLRLSSDRRI